MCECVLDVDDEWMLVVGRSIGYRGCVCVIGVYVSVCVCARVCLIGVYVCACMNMNISLNLLTTFENAAKISSYYASRGFAKHVSGEDFVKRLENFNSVSNRNVQFFL